LIFVCFPDVTESDFRVVIEQSTPGLIFELRPVPRFDIGKLNRQSAFQLFRTHGTRYVELTPADGRHRSWDEVLQSLRQVGTSLDLESRPVMFLVNLGDLTEAHVRGITRALPRPDRQPWRVCEVPQFRLLEVEQGSKPEF